MYDVVNGCMMYFNGCMILLMDVWCILMDVSLIIYYWQGQYLVTFHQQCLYICHIDREDINK